MDGVRGIETSAYHSYSTEEAMSLPKEKGAHAISRSRVENTFQERIRRAQENVATGNHPCARIRKAIQKHNIAELQKETGSYYRTRNTAYKTYEEVGSIINKKV